MITAQAVREALTELAPMAAENDGYISKLDLAAKLHICSSLERGRFNDVLKAMVRKGTLVRSEDKQSIRYIPEAAPPINTEEAWARVFRACRTAKGAFDLDYIAKVAAVSSASAKSKIGKMTELGYLEGFLQEGEVLYRSTKLLRDTPEVPLAPKPEKAPLTQAREALAELAKMFIILDLTSEAVKTKVREQIGILQSAFEKGVESDVEEN